MIKQKRDYKAEYQRRIERGVAKGRSRSQARGHARPHESHVAPKRRKPPSKTQIEQGLTLLAKGSGLRDSARAAGLSEERFRDYVSRQGLAEKVGGRWKIRKEVHRELPIFSKGKAFMVTVNDVNGDLFTLARYLGSVSRFLDTGEPQYLEPFKNTSVKDVHGSPHPLETRPNVLYRLQRTEHFQNIYNYVF